tara:strand:- start:14836 stop:15639 length:804 start_codon:yes stop_codon:yes gene_type:complete
MDFTLPEPSLTKTRADFRDVEFRKLIAQKGLNVKWTQTAQCPCSVKTEDLNMDIDYIGANAPDKSIDYSNQNACTVCDGGGKIYHSPQDIQAVVTGAEGDYLNARFGGYRDGVINLTLNPEHLPAFGDRFELLDSVMLYQETIEDNGQNTLALRFPIQRRTLALVGGNKTVGVTYCSYAVNNLTVDAELEEGIHFDVLDNEISWRANQKPENVTKFTFSYYIHPSYICVGFPNSVRDTHVRFKQTVEVNTPLPIRIQAKLEFLEGAT